MSPIALALVLSSALFHATWNLLAKRAAGGVAFVWLFASLTALLYAPAAAFFLLLERPSLGGGDLLFIAGSSALHLGYFLSLQRGYRLGDLSLVYPLARGSGPLLATLVAIIFLGEQPTALALTGTLVIVSSVFILASGPGAMSSGQRNAILYGLSTGVFIAAYTVWDSYGVATLGIHPLLYSWLSEVIRTLLLGPSAWQRRREVAREWRCHRREALGVALLSPLAYILVLTALVFTPISYVAPSREISILIGTIMGAGLLFEGDVRRRLLAAGGMVVGVTLLVLG